MTIIFLKSILSVVMMFLAFVSMITMFEVFGRTELRYDIKKLKKIHKITGIIYLLIFLFITYYCFRFIVLSQSELSTRSTFHSVFALSILVMFGVKILFTRIYRQYYNQVKMLGLLMSLTTFGLVGTSGGYYLLVTKFGTDMTFDKTMQLKQRGRLKTAEKTGISSQFVIQTDDESISRGKNLFIVKCSLCHDPWSTETIVGPGLKGVLKKTELPVSGRPAIAENIMKQLRQPFKRMPSFEYLSDEEVANLIAFLNTL
jgi:cytochrome c2